MSKIKSEAKKLNEFTELPRRHSRINPTGKPTKYWVAVDEYSDSLNSYSKYVMPNLQLKDVDMNATPSLTVDKAQAIALAKRATQKWPTWHVFVGQDKYSHGMQTGKDHLRASTLYIWDPVVKMWNDNIVAEADDEDDPNYPEFDEKSLKPSERKDYDRAAAIQEISFERELTKAEEDEFRQLIKRLPDLAKDYLLGNLISKTGLYARPSNHSGRFERPWDENGKYLGGTIEVPAFDYRRDPHVTPYQRRKASKAATDAKQKEEFINGIKEKINNAENGGVLSIEDWKNIYNAIPKADRKEWLEEIKKTIREEAGNDTALAEQQIAVLLKATGKNITDDDLKDLIIGFTKKHMTKQGAGKVVNRYANAIRQALISTIGHKLPAEVRSNILKGIKIPGASGFNALGIPEKFINDMSDGEFEKFVLNVKAQLEELRKLSKQQGGGLESGPTDAELDAIEKGEDVAEAMMKEALKAKQVCENYDYRAKLLDLIDNGVLDPAEIVHDILTNWMPSNEADDCAHDMLTDRDLDNDEEDEENDEEGEELDEAKVDLSKIEGTFANVILKNISKVWACKSKEEVIALCHQLLDDAKIDTPWTRKFFIRLGQCRDLVAAQKYVAYSYLAGSGLGTLGKKRFDESVKAKIAAVNPMNAINLDDKIAAELAKELAKADY